MSTLSELNPACLDQQGAAVELVIEPGVKDLGGFRVRRALPSIKRRMVGPFIFLDEMGPSLFDPGQGLDVRPHPHIGLATLTYMTEGRIRHRDSLGSRQNIEPGAVNWMTAGRGIVHSERSPEEDRAAPRSLRAVQSWVALPRALEETAPGFFHHASDALPLVSDSGTAVRVVTGRAYGAASPVRTFSETLYLDVRLDAGAALPVPTDIPERAVYILDGQVEIAGEAFDAHRLLVLRPDDAITLRATVDARLLVIGGEPMDGPRHIWWNFVSSSKERIEAAKADWQAGRFAAVPGESEFIPLPT